MASKEFQVSSLSDLVPVCDYLSSRTDENKIVLFSGEMGAGKTTLIKAFCGILGVEDEVNSPTFSLVNEYDSPNGPIYHFDLYRICSEEELYDIGYEDYFFSGYLCLIEWPEMALGVMPVEHLLVQLRLENHHRIVTVTEKK